MLRLDRQPHQALGRRSLRAQIHAAKAGQQVVHDQSPPLCEAKGQWTACARRSGAEADGPQRRCAASWIVDSALYRKTTEGQPARLDSIRETAAVAPTQLPRLDRFGQTR